METRTTPKPMSAGDLACAEEAIMASLREEALADRRFAGWKARRAVLAA